jgi:hypothetical protein
MLRMKQQSNDGKGGLGDELWLHVWPFIVTRELMFQLIDNEEVRPQS